MEGNSLSATYTLNNRIPLQHWRNPEELVYLGLKSPTENNRLLPNPRITIHTTPPESHLLIVTRLPEAHHNLRHDSVAGSVTCSKSSQRLQTEIAEAVAQIKQDVASKYLSLTVFDIGLRDISVDSSFLIEDIAKE